MSGHDERAMLLFAQLAAVAARKQQIIGRNRFLVLTGIAAIRAGWPDVASCCHDIITAESPHHLVSHFSSFSDALRDSDFATFAKQTERFCSPERAEHLLNRMHLERAAVDDARPAGDVALALLKPLTTE